MNILVTGVAGFIGSATAEKLLNLKNTIIGIDDLNDYYDKRIKLYRLEKLKKYSDFIFLNVDISQRQALDVVFTTYNIDCIVNLAARAGVRYSIENPHIYYMTNLIGLVNLLELSRQYPIKNLVQASTSSVYAGSPLPFTEDNSVNCPISPYAASKKSAEVTCYTYHYLYDLNINILRYFTVYGPAGRPDMSIFRFIEQIKKDVEIVIYGDGAQERDFTYIDDIVAGTIGALKLEGFNIINLGNDNPVKLNSIITLIEKKLHKKAKKVFKDFHKADMEKTWANINKAKELLKWQPEIDIEKGINKTVNWHLENASFLKDINL